MSAMPWLPGATCVELGPFVFSVPPGLSEYDRGQHMKVMRRVCHRCPAFRTCEEWSLSDETLPGFIAGRSARERTEYHKNKRRESAA